MKRFSLFVFRVILVHLIFIFKTRQKNQRKYMVKLYGHKKISKLTRTAYVVWWYIEKAYILLYLPYKFNICLKYLEETLLVKS